MKKLLVLVMLSLSLILVLVLIVGCQKTIPKPYCGDYEAEVIEAEKSYQILLLEYEENPTNKTEFYKNKANKFMRDKQYLLDDCINQ
jgi:hypothetical protein